MTPDELIDAHLDDALDAEGQRGLEAWLLADPENRRRFLRAVMDHRALLGLQAAGALRSTAPRPPLRRRRSARRPSRAPWFAMAALAALLLLGIGLAPLFATRVPAGPLVAESHGATAAGSALVGGQRLAPGSAIAAGDGLLLHFPDGSEVRLAAGTQAVLPAAGVGMRLERGSLAAEVRPQEPGRPALFTAPGATATVIGTALDVDADGGEARIAVRHGRVGVVRDADGAAVTLDGGQECLVADGVPLIARPIGSPSGRLLAVGSGQPYADLAALPEPQAGDVIELHAGTYREAKAFAAAGTALRPVVVRGAADARPLIDGTGIVLTGLQPVPRALLQVAGGHWVFENLDLANGRNGMLASAIRSIAGGGIAVRGCRITACDQGIDAIADELRIEDCVLSGNGAPGSTSATHALRLDGLRAVVRGNRIEDTRNGVSLRASVEHLRLEANRIGGGEEGEIALLGRGGAHAAELIGNLIVSRAGRTGNSTRFISIEGGTARLELLRDTCVAAEPRIIFLSAIGGTHAARIDGCIFAGSDALCGSGFSTTGSRNWLPATLAVPAGLTERIGSGDADPGFVAPLAGDFRMKPGSTGQTAMPRGDACPAWEPPASAGTAAVRRAPDQAIGAFAPQR